MSGEVPLPAIEGIQSADFDLEDNTDAPESVLSKAMQRSVRSGDRWSGALVFPKAQGDDAGVLNAWLRQARRGDRWFWLTPPHAFVRGNWNPAELISNGSFLDGTTTGWTAQNSGVLSVNTRRMKILNGAAASGRAQQNIAMEAGKPHIVLVDAARGKSTAAQVQVVRQSDSGIEANSGAVVAPDRIALLCTPSVSAMQLRLILNDTTLGNDLFYSGVRVGRCLQVAGAGQTGNRITVDGAPASMNAAIKAGEFVTVPVTPGSTLRYRLLQLVEDLDTDAAGAGTIVFEPTLSVAPADNAAVIVRYPFGRFRIPRPAPVALSASDGGPWHGFAVSVLEDITP